MNHAIGGDDVGSLHQSVFGGYECSGLRQGQVGALDRFDIAVFDGS